MLGMSGAEGLDCGATMCMHERTEALASGLLLTALTLSSQPMVHHSNSGGMAALLLLPAWHVVHCPFSPSQVDSISPDRPIFVATV